MMTVSKSVAGALAAVLLTTAVATPAEARHRRDYDRRGGGISLGDVMLGTIAIAGVAAAATALGNRDRGYDDGRYDNRRREDRYDRRYQERGYDDRNYSDHRYDDSSGQGRSVKACARQAEREVGERFGGRATFAGVDGIDRSNREGYRIRGTVDVRDGYARGRYARGEGRVNFNCTAQYGEVVGLNVGSAYVRSY